MINATNKFQGVDAIIEQSTIEINNPKIIDKDVLAGVVIADGASADLISTSQNHAPNIVKIKASGTGHQPWGSGQLDIVKFINLNL